MNNNRGYAMMNPKDQAGQDALDICHLDHEVDTFTQRRGIELTPELKSLLRDAMLWMAARMVDIVEESAAPDDDRERRWTKAEHAVYDAMTGFARVENAWIDRTRTALGLPERDFKTLRDTIAAKCSRHVASAGPASHPQ
jgi:hypothetical protein